MQPTIAGGGNSSDGGAGQSRGGLARFRSAPATWLEALLEDEEEDPLKPAQNLTQLLASTSNPAPARPFVDPSLFQPPTFQRQNSSPPDFLANSATAYFSTFGVHSNYDYISSNSDVSPSAERGTEAELQTSSVKLSQIKGEQSCQGPARASTLIEMEMDKLLEDSVPCRVRAKRGFATHPRSIAERVRRTRISDRIRKLQELVPNMDKDVTKLTWRFERRLHKNRESPLTDAIAKCHPMYLRDRHMSYHQQTNTADMLEEAVEYVKFLQKQIQELTEHQRKCTCTSKE